MAVSPLLEKYRSLATETSINAAFDPAFCCYEYSILITDYTLCDSEVLIFNNTNAAPFAECLVNGPRKFDSHVLFIDDSFRGQLKIPGLVTIREASFSGRSAWGGLSNDGLGATPAYPANVTSLDMPDLEKVSSMFTIDVVDKLSTLSLPKLKRVGLALNIDLSGGPAINLTFPSLADVSYIILEGNIDAIEMPALNKSLQINVTSTGNLNCTAFAASVVNATPPYDSVFSKRNETVVCVSNTGNVTTFKPYKAPSGSIRLLSGWGCFLWTAFIGFAIVSLQKI